jgi:hypothetical protein
MRIALVVALLAGCYDPELRDCTVECNSGDECADGQVCGTSGMCAAAEAADECAPGGGSAPPRVSLRVSIDGPGEVVVEGQGTCTTDDSHDPCMYSFAAGALVTLHARAIDDEKPFEQWTGMCAGQSATCTLAATPAMTVGARFK